jgi:hypothetical protein
MFKYLIFRAIEDVLMIFNDADAVPAAHVQELLEEANSKAAPLWWDEATPFVDRQAACRKILDPIIKMNSAVKVHEFRKVPCSIVGALDEIFRRFYNKPSVLLLIGRTDEQAYEIQDDYARAIVELLENVDPAYGCRAITRLRKVYGRGALPLLSMSSASGIWQLCQSSFYRKQIYLVSSSCPLYRLPY